MFGIKSKRAYCFKSKCAQHGFLKFWEHITFRKTSIYYQLQKNQVNFARLFFFFPAACVHGKCFLWCSWMYCSTRRHARILSCFNCIFVGDVVKAWIKNLAHHSTIACNVYNNASYYFSHAVKTCVWHRVRQFFHTIDNFWNQSTKQRRLSSTDWKHINSEHIMIDMCY